MENVPAPLQRYVVDVHKLKGKYYFTSLVHVGEIETEFK